MHATLIWPYVTPASAPGPGPTGAQLTGKSKVCFFNTWPQVGSLAMCPRTKSDPCKERCCRRDEDRVTRKNMTVFLQPAFFSLDPPPPPPPPHPRAVRWLCAGLAVWLGRRRRRAHCPCTRAPTPAACSQFRAGGSLQCEVAREGGQQSAGGASSHSVGFVLIRAADFSAQSAQAPRPYRQALIKSIWRGSDRVE